MVTPNNTNNALDDNVDPIILQIVEGSLNSIEAEIEYAIERTALTPNSRPIYSTHSLYG